MRKKSPHPNRDGGLQGFLAGVVAGGAHAVIVDGGRAVALRTRCVVALRAGGGGRTVVRLVAEGVFAVVLVVRIVATAEEEVGDGDQGPDSHDQREGETAALLAVTRGIGKLLGSGFDP